MNSTKKVNVSILLVVMLLQVFVLGSLPAATAGDEAPNQVTIEWLGVHDTSLFTKGIEDDRVMQALAERTGVTIDWGLNVGVADTNAKLAVMLAGDDLPDVVTPINNSELDAQLVASGQILELDDLVAEYGPNIIKNCGLMLDYNREMRSNGTGKLYGINMHVGQDSSWPDGIATSWNIRWDLYKELGCPELHTLDDMLELLIKMQELEPETPDGQKTYGLGYFLGESWGSVMIDRAYMFDMGLCNSSACEAVYVDAHNEAVVPRVTDPDGAYWASLEFLNKAYLAGVLDPESATLKFSTYMEKAEQQRYHAAVQNMFGSANALLLAEPNNKGYVPIIIKAHPDGAWTNTVMKIGSQAVAYISKNSKYGKEIVQMLNYLATEEGQILIRHGIEGQDWEFNEKGEGVFIGELLEAYKTKTVITKESGIGKYGWSLNVYNPPKLSNGTYSNFSFNTVIEQPLAYQEFCEHFGIKTVGEYGDIMGGFGYDYTFMTDTNIPMNSDAGIKNANVNNYVVTRIAKAIFCESEEEFQSTKATMIQEMNDLGAEDVIAEYTRIYDECIAKYKLIG